MIILFHMQIWIVLIMACVAVTHAMPRARGRGRGKPTHDVHEPKDASCSFEAWDAAYKKGKRAKRSHEPKDASCKKSYMDMETRSVFSRYLLESWGFGLKSALVVQKEAAMAVADGAEHNDLIMLAKLGCASHDDDVGPLMCVAHTCLCTSMLAHYVSCTWPYLSRLQGYMVPKQPSNVNRDLMRRVGDMFQGVTHDIPVSSFPMPMLISKGPKEGQRSSDISRHINSSSKCKKNY